jgi:aspartate aminotransferase-like enzyme
MMKSRLFTPGPTPVPERVLLRMAQPLYHHRTDYAKAVFRQASEKLKKVFFTDQPVLPLTCSGTGGAEAAIVSLFSPGDKGIYMSNGKFSTRWGEMMRVFGMKTIAMEAEWGQTITEKQIIQVLTEHPDVQCVWLVHSETSTGTFTDVQKMSVIIHEHSNALVCVDGISSVACHECRMDEWGIDVLITGSQKGFMLPPGLALVALSERAWKKTETSTMPKMYFNLQKARVAAEKNDTTPWTPAMVLIDGLDASLDMILEEGLENVWSRHDMLSQKMRTGLHSMEVQLFAATPSHAVTAAYLPNSAPDLVRRLQNEFGITIANGQENFKGRIFRVGHLGYYDKQDIEAVLYAIRSVLKEE